jgi:TPR repeat protein
VRADEREAARWLQAAAGQGFADALERLAGYQAAGRGGLSPDATAAADIYYRAGLAYLQQDRKDGARRCLEALRALEKEGSLAPPHATLAERLAAALAGR